MLARCQDEAHTAGRGDGAEPVGHLGCSGSEGLEGGSDLKPPRKETGRTTNTQPVLKSSFTLEPELSQTSGGCSLLSSGIENRTRDSKPDKCFPALSLQLRRSRETQLLRGVLCPETATPHSFILSLTHSLIPHPLPGTNIQQPMHV